MNPTHSQNQISNPENFPPSFITTYHEDTQDNNISPQPVASASPGPGAFPTLLLPSGSHGFPGAPANFASDYHVTSAAQHSTSAETNSVNPQNQFQPTHPTFFFYQPPNDFRHYYVKLKEIPYDTIPFLLSDLLNGRNIQFNENEFIFYYRQQYNNRFYQASCEIVPHLLINHCLNKNFLGIELQQDMGQENLAFTAEQKENLEYHLKQRLIQYLLN